MHFLVTLEELSQVRGQSQQRQPVTTISEKFGKALFSNTLYTESVEN